VSELAHYGVKGMKWGVRREAKRNFKAYMGEANRRVQNYQWDITEAEYKRMSAKPIALGKDFHRITSQNNTNLRDFVYVTNNKDDRDRYRAFFGPGGNVRKVSKKDELRIKTTKEARSPGEKERVDAYIKVLGEGLKKNREVQDAFGGPEAARSLNAREVGFRTYRQVMQSGHENTSIHSAYFKEIQRRGYTALMDDADRGIFSKTPIILFPKDSNARVVEIKPLSKEDIMQAKLDLKPFDY
jgi:hypothetical protein